MFGLYTVSSKENSGFRPTRRLSYIKNMKTDEVQKNISSGISDARYQSFLSGAAHPTTAQELLHARYQAIVRGDIDYIIQTTHSKTHGDIVQAEVEEWSKNSKWLGLEIKKTAEGLEPDQKGEIIFRARFIADGKTQDHWEHSLFEKEDGQWRFVDAQNPKGAPVVRSEPKVGRNDPCTCGSGKKFKKCHGME